MSATPFRLASGWIVLALLGAGIASGCSSILGIEEYGHRPAPTPAATGGAGASSATGGVGGSSAAEAGDSGGPGSGGTSGGAATGSGGGEVGGSAGASSTSGGKGGKGGSGSSGRAGSSGESGAGTAGSMAGEGGTMSGPKCGDATVKGNEACDDGNTDAGDGCDEGCAREDGWSCTSTDPTRCQEVCGDNKLVGDEALAGGCDDGDTEPDDGCSATCRVEPGWFCSMEPSVCANTCGNGMLDNEEECDDNNDDPDDGCNACAVVDGWECDGQPSTCNDINECDDGLDQCDAHASCDNTIPGYTCTCDTGYSGNGKTCDQVDECTAGGNDCHVHADCMDTPGSWTCACKTGYTGNGTTSCKPLITAVSAGALHTCAIVGDGSVRCWGNGASGRLGYVGTANLGDTEGVPTADVDVGGKVTQISAGGSHTCALLVGGKVRCWGTGATGRLGYNNTDDIGDTETPASAGDVNIGGTATQVVAGGRHTCALLTTGNVRCWGDANYGQLGYGNTNPVGDNETPASAGDVPIGGTATQITAGIEHTCALMTGGKVRCWGAGYDGRLGYNNDDNIGDTETPASAGDVSMGDTAKAVVAGGYNTCAIMSSSGGLLCWGEGAHGRTGQSNTNNVGDNETPASVGEINIGGPITSVGVSGHTCAVLNAGTVRCFGYGAAGRLGTVKTNDIGDNEPPANEAFVDVGGTVKQISATGNHTCALLDAGGVRCWGDNPYGQLGYGNTNDIGDNETPASAGDVNIQ